jgi:hypothetical protein
VAKASEIAGTIGGLAELSTARSSRVFGTTQTVEDIIAALKEFNECVRYLNTRRSAGTILKMDSEAAVQDSIYLIVRPWVPDLVPEAPTDKSGNRFTVRDFRSKALHVVIEAKYVRDKQHGRTITKELHDDIEVYRHCPYCDTILFFIYDPDSHIPDERELRRPIEQSRVYDGRQLRCVLIVKP